MTSAHESSADEILLITRLRTMNKGNQALSEAWLAILRQTFPDAPIRAIERRPRHLLQYTLRNVASASDPFSAFEAIASALARLAPGPDYVGPAGGADKIVLDETLPRKPRFARLRARLNMRGRLARVGAFRDEYRCRLAAFQRSRLVVANPAGEFFPRRPEAAFYHLLDARVAQKLGTPTAIVNHTMDIDDPTLRSIIPKMYRTLALVGFRDATSVVAFKAMGGDPSNVVVAPDLALTTKISDAPTPRTKSIAIAINTPEAAARGYLEQWVRIVEGVRAKGYQVDLVSNELPADRPFYLQLERRFPDLKIAGADLGHEAYARLLASYDIIVTSRMHTGILGMVSGTPVVAVEGASFKITGLFEELGIASPVIRPTDDGWTTRVIDEVVRISSRRNETANELTARVGAARERITAMLVPRLRAAADGDAQAAS